MTRHRHQDNGRNNNFITLTVSSLTCLVLLDWSMLLTMSETPNETGLINRLETKHRQCQDNETQAIGLTQRFAVSTLTVSSLTCLVLSASQMSLLPFSAAAQPSFCFFSSASQPSFKESTPAACFASAACVPGMVLPFSEMYCKPFALLWCADYVQCKQLLSCTHCLTPCLITWCDSTNVQKIYGQAQLSLQPRMTDLS